MKNLDYLSGVLDSIAIQSEISDEDCSWTELTVLSVNDTNLTDEESLKSAYLDFYSDCYDVNERESLISEDWQIVQSSISKGTPIDSLEQLIDKMIAYDTRFTVSAFDKKSQLFIFDNDRVEVFRDFLVKTFVETLGEITRITEYTMYPPFEVGLSWHYYLVVSKQRTVFIEWLGFH
ncbi:MULTISPECIES: hypothetical protein [Psychrobacter]|uniref:hypothetical protein n=1 Tax=Psychrobacter TaxID=497 RepID=UPI001919EE3F|nr:MULTISPECIES: hypothetical protein [Psychrobacter]